MCKLYKQRLKKVETTLTLLPRQSPLYYPVSFVVSGFDRLYMTFFLKHKLSSEGHILHRKYLKYRGPGIQNIGSLTKENLDDSINGFLILYKNDQMKETLRDVIKNLDKEGSLCILKHLAIVPNKNTLFFLIVPKEKLWKGFTKHIVRFASTLGA